MPNWSNSDRRSRLPSNWSTLRRLVLDRDGKRCTFIYPNGGRCHEVATDVDHIKPSGSDDMTNLTSLCSRHHRIKSSREGAQALNKKRAEIKSRFRREMKDPGYL